VTYEGTVDVLDGSRPRPRHKVFGLGLSRTGTRSLTEALRLLGWDTIHYPIGPDTLRTLERGDARFAVLEHRDGITDITVCRYYEALDRNWPGSKFVLTVRDRDAWLASCRKHWAKNSVAAPEQESEQHRIHLEIRRFLRAAVFAGYDFNKDRFATVYDRHVAGVTRYFAGRSEDLLVLDIAGGDDLGRLTRFLGVPMPQRHFPHVE
jgi:hypothetical protein